MRGRDGYRPGNILFFKKIFCFLTYTRLQKIRRINIISILLIATVEKGLCYVASNFFFLSRFHAIFSLLLSFRFIDSTESLWILSFIGLYIIYIYMYIHIFQ